ncbi:GNAT family acetyltransferase [Paenibacillus sp. FSL L8-0663]|uniref:GNAT family acetyltransferase n=1 Tax=Paenibacillus sp. FSL L8-0663 TaxID=2921606 RepID=UPI0030FBE4A1
MIYRNATVDDISAIVELQKKYHITTISEKDKPDGFVTTLFTEEQFKELIEKENGITIACHGQKIIAYVMAASWKYWAKWPLFQFMIGDLKDTEYKGTTLSTENTYQYGPICIDMDYRGTVVLRKVFDFSRMQMSKKYPILITFINHINHRSYAAHTKKLGLDVIKSFDYNNNTYYELGCYTSE